MSETLRFFLLQTALLGVVLILHTYLGLHIIRRTLVFSDLVLDQLAAFGVLVAVGLGIEYGAAATYLSSLVAVLFGAALLALVKPSNPLIPREAVIGILYALALVASLLLGDKLPGGGAYVTKTLAGAMLWVSWPLVGVTAVVYVALLVFHFAFRAQFIGLTHNSGTVRNERLWDFLFFTTQGIITVLIVPVAGVLLAYAFLMIPAATAAMFTKQWKGAILLGWSLGFIACLTGLGASHRFDLPYGPSLVLALGALFIGAVLVRSMLPRCTEPAASEVSP
ncbi:MAG: metal ABC transporter permease [Candidatus Hydrogenedentes bacterium]|nr:metal ABC transporter permease [Candidatus Hydrogenedentota bacterium]